MALPQDHISMALFCDFENVALGVRDAKYDKFDIKRVLERLLLKGSIVVKKAYCDWERYKGFKATMHEANFELIEIPHVRQSGKNSADIRLVVDALDLCYTKSHVNTFVIISGDSDFSPLVSKLRENAKHVIGVGVKQSTSDLLIANCDEFIFYDDLVRESQRNGRRDESSRDESRESQQQPRRSPEEERQRRETMESRRSKGVNMAAETFEAMVAERGDSRVWASVLKEALKRRNPGFSEGYFGFKTFGNLLEEAQARGLLEFGRDDKSGAYVSRGSGQAASPAALTSSAPAPASAPRNEAAPQPAERSSQREASLPRRHAFHPPVAPPQLQSAQAPEQPVETEADTQEREHAPEGNRRGNRGGRGGRGGRQQQPQQLPREPSAQPSPRQLAAEVAAQLMAEEDEDVAHAAQPVAAAEPVSETASATAKPAAKRKPPARKKATTAATTDSGEETSPAPEPRARRPASKKAAKPDPQD